MGWTSYHVETPIDRKAECDKLFDDKIIVKSVMVGSVYYAAIREKNGRIWAAIVPTKIKRGNYIHNFWYKEMAETMDLCCYDCPAAILDVLTPTENEHALTWRETCRRYNTRKYKMHRLPVGTVIAFKCSYEMLSGAKPGDTIQLRKIQEKSRTAWSDGQYKWRISEIPLDYKVIKEKM